MKLNKIKKLKLFSNFIVKIKFWLKMNLIRRPVPNYFDAASNREAIFTFGLKYDASILNVEPIAP